jgi:glycerol-3-phosphate acyltransferase PlsX
MVKTGKSGEGLALNASGTRDGQRVTKIAIDAMGGDFGPTVTIPGAALALERYPDLHFMFFGKEAEVMPELNRFAELKSVSTFVHCEVSVAMNDKPSQALRQGRWKSSMWKSIEAVKTEEAGASVSAATPAR